MYLFFSFLHSKTLLDFTCFLVLGSQRSSLPLFLGPILWPLSIPCSCLTIYLFPFLGIWEPSLRRRGAMTTLASSACAGCHGALGSLCLLLCQGAFMEGDESPRKDKVICFSIVFGLVRGYSCCTTTWGFVVF